MSDTSILLVYLTAGSPEDARRIGRSLVDEQLAACVNIFDSMTSIYPWQGAIEEARETVIIAKTRSDLFDALATRVRALHSYTTPCIVALPTARVEANYLAWLLAETRPSPT